MAPKPIPFDDQVQPEPNSGCLIWLGATRGHGYGVLNFRKRATGAHRVAYIMARGEVPDDLHVLHKCDTPCCVNPNHLFLGTHQDNMIDRSKKKRGCYIDGLSHTPEYHAEYKREWRERRRAAGLRVT